MKAEEELALHKEMLQERKDAEIVAEDDDEDEEETVHQETHKEKHRKSKVTSDLCRYRNPKLTWLFRMQ